MSAPLVSVIIPHYNDLANLERCLTFLAAQTLPKGQFEVIVADNNSHCGIDEVRRVCGDFVHVVSAPVPGAGPARNIAIEASRGRYLAFTDQDCRPAPNWLEQGLDALSTSEMVGGRVEIEYEDPGCPTAVEAFERVFAFNVQRYVKKLGFGVTANMFVPREVFDRVGGFRPEGPDDLEWGQRATSAGYRWRYRPEVVVAHPARRDWAGLTQKWRRLTQMASVPMLEARIGRMRWFLRSLLILASPLVHWMNAATSPKLGTVEQRVGAIGVLFRIRLWRFMEANRLLREYERRSGTGPFLRRPF
jgi:glycosyltransferase involved in cell wall biosynthesis